MDGKLVVLGILSRDRPEDFLAAKKEMKSAALEWMDKQTQNFQRERQDLRDAKQLRIEEAEDRNDQRALRAAKSIRINMDKSEQKEVGFAWVDGVFWERWIRSTYGVEVKDSEKVIINDEDVSVRSTYLNYPLTFAEPEILGYLYHWQSHHGIADINPRNDSQSRRCTTKNQAKIHNWQYREILLQYQRCHLGTPISVRWACSVYRDWRADVWAEANAKEIRRFL